MSLNSSEGVPHQQRHLECKSSRSRQLKVVETHNWVKVGPDPV